jgi:hypothetical protein
MERARPAPPDVIAWVGIPLALLAFHCATLGGYGIFRDELYYLACADHLDWGYVDHPPLSILVLAAFRALIGDSVSAVRFPAALAGTGMVLLAVSTARALGGGAFAQRLAALSAALFPLGIALSGFYSMNALDLVFWSAGIRLAAAILAGGDPRLWLAFGAVAGLGLQNKISVLLLGFGLVLGVPVSGRLALLKNRWVWLGGGLAVLLFLPHLAWQVDHGWPTLEFMANARQYKMTGTDPAGFFSEQILNANPGAIPVWLGAVIFLLAAAAARPWRPLGWAFVVIVGVLVATGAKAYYLGPAFPLLYAAGGVAWERWTSRRWARAAIVGLVIAGSLPALPLTKGILPVGWLVTYLRASGIMPSSGERNALGRLPQHFADQHGWAELASAVAGVRDALPPDERQRVCIAGQNYGQAGAIDYYGRELGLPRAVSGHNSYWLWGPRDCGREVWIVIGDDRESLEAIFESVEQALTFECDLCMPYEGRKPIWVARRMKQDPAALWPSVKHFI